MNNKKRQVYKTIITRRTIRRFKQRQISEINLIRLINAARLAPSAANLQPLEFIIIKNKAICNRLFPHLRWAGYITPHGAPAADKQPVAYIAILVNKNKAQPKYAAYDVGAAAQSILLAAWEQGLGGCWMQAINRRRIRQILNIAQHNYLDSIISLGFRAETPIIEKYNNSVKYWKDTRGILHVPKRDIVEVLYKIL